MPTVSHIDNENRLIYLHANTVNQSIHPLDIYREVRAIRHQDPVNQGHSQFMRGDGYIPKGGGKFTERYFTLLDGARIVPYDVSHVLSITGTLLTDDGQEGVFAFNRTPLSVGVFVDIQYIPQQVEVITVQAGSGLDAEQDAILREIRSGIEQSINVNVNNVVSGDGTPTNPFNSFAFATAYGNLKGIKKLIIHSSMSLDASVEGFEVIGLNHQVLDLNGVNVEGSSFTDLQITGSSTGSATYRECNVLGGTTGMNGIYYETAISGDVETEDGAFIILSSCLSGIAGSGRPKITVNGTVSLAMRQYSGGVALEGIVDGCAITIGLADGECRFETSCTGGDVHIRGVGFYENLGTITVEDRALVKMGATKTDVIVASQL